MFQDAALKPLLTEESYTLHGKEAQHFFANKLYTAARRGDKFRELVQDVFENVRSTICVGWDAAQKATHYLPRDGSKLRRRGSVASKWTTRSSLFMLVLVGNLCGCSGQPVWVQWATCVGAVGVCQRHCPGLPSAVE